MDIIVPSLNFGNSEVEIADTAQDHCWFRPVGYGVLPLYQEAFEQSSGEIVAFLHDDVSIYEPGWDLRVEREFLDNNHVGVVGFGGALRHGSSDIYKSPYSLQQLGRSDYYSNTDDAELHGTRFTGEMNAAVLDGFCLIARRELLEKMGGWQPDVWPPHH